MERASVAPAPGQTAPRAEAAVRGEAPSIAPRMPWPAGRIALSVAGIGLAGAALGALWLGIAEPLGLNPGGTLGRALVLAALAVAVLGVLVLLGGLGYYVLAPGFMGSRMAWRRVGSHRLVIATTILIALLAYAGPLAFVALTGEPDLRTLSGLLVGALSVDVALLAVAYLRFIRPGVLTIRDLGIDRRLLARHVGIGLLVGVSVLIVSAVIQASLRAVGVQQTQLANLEFVREFPLLGFVALVLAGGVLAPIAEELYFRGFVFRTYLHAPGTPRGRLPGEGPVRYAVRRVVKARGPVVAYGATSLLFATLHLNLPALLPILVLSLIFCYAYHRTGSIVPSVVGHALNNSIAFCILYFTTAPLGG